MALGNAALPDKLGCTSVTASVSISTAPLSKNTGVETGCVIANRTSRCSEVVSVSFETVYVNV